MGIRDVTAASIRKAMDEFDQIGRDNYLRKYGLGPARGYYIVVGSRRYDTRAIIGGAHGFLPGQAPLKPSDFGRVSERDLVPIVRAHGFSVATPQDAASQSLPFMPGHIYNRRRDIHGVYGGQEQGGMSTPRDAPYIFLFTGEMGHPYGYEDHWREDGMFAYAGEGQIGDMLFDGANRRLRDHRELGLDILLFESVKTKSDSDRRFVGLFDCAGWEIVNGPDREGNTRKIIIFHLARAAHLPIDNEQPLPSALSGLSKAELRKAALQAASIPPGDSGTRIGTSTYYQRSAIVRAYVLKRADGRCEGCAQQAPFLNRNSQPYLEPHHTTRLADGGPDHPSHVAALCPTCHRRIHYGNDGTSFNKIVQNKITTLEAEQPN